MAASSTLRERIAALQQRGASPQPASPPRSKTPTASTSGVAVTALRDKIASFEQKGGVPIPRGSFGLGAPPQPTGKRNNELWGNRIPSTGPSSGASASDRAASLTVKSAAVRSRNVSLVGAQSRKPQDAAGDAAGPVIVDSSSSSDAGKNNASALPSPSSPHAASSRAIGPRSPINDGGASGDLTPHDDPSFVIAGQVPTPSPSPPRQLPATQGAQPKPRPALHVDCALATGPEAEAADDCSYPEEPAARADPAAAEADDPPTSSPSNSPLFTPSIPFPTFANGSRPSTPPRADSPPLPSPPRADRRPAHTTAPSPPHLARATAESLDSNSDAGIPSAKNLPPLPAAAAVEIRDTTTTSMTMPPVPQVEEDLSLSGRTAPPRPRPMRARAPPAASPAETVVHRSLPAVSSTKNGSSDHQNSEHQSVPLPTLPASIIDLSEFSTRLPTSTVDAGAEALDTSSPARTSSVRLSEYSQASERSSLAGEDGLPQRPLLALPDPPATRPAAAAAAHRLDCSSRPSTPSSSISAGSSCDLTPIALEAFPDVPHFLPSRRSVHGPGTGTVRGAPHTFAATATANTTTTTATSGRPPRQERMSASSTKSSTPSLSFSSTSSSNTSPTSLSVVNNSNNNNNSNNINMVGAASGMQRTKSQSSRPNPSVPAWYDDDEDDGETGWANVIVTTRRY